MVASLENRRIIVTGAAGGIGAGVVKGLADRGARIAAIHNKSGPSDELLALASWHQCDLTERQMVADTFKAVVDHLGGLDALINVAGVWQGGALEEVGEDQIDFLIGANLKSAIFTNQAAFNAMKAKGGRIVNFGSVEGLEGNPDSPVYAAAKAAVHGWTRSAARRWASYGVTVNCIAPAMHTPPFERIRNSASEEERALIDKSVADKIPLGRLGDPEKDCTPMIAFLASEESRFVTGQLLAVDGGLRMLGA